MEPKKFLRIFSKNSLMAQGGIDVKLILRMSTLGPSAGPEDGWKMGGRYLGPKELPEEYFDGWKKHVGSGRSTPIISI